MIISGHLLLTDHSIDEEDQPHSAAPYQGTFSQDDALKEHFHDSAAKRGYYPQITISLTPLERLTHQGHRETTTKRRAQGRKAAVITTLAIFAPPLIAALDIPRRLLLDGARIGAGALSTGIAAALIPLRVTAVAYVLLQYHRIRNAKR